MLLSKMTCIAFKLQFYILSALAFPGNQTHDLAIARAMLNYLRNLYASKCKWATTSDYRGQMDHIQ